MTKRKDPKDCKKAGRKSNYRPSYVKKVQEYIDHCNNTAKGEERELPTRIGLALRLKTSNVTLIEWGKKNPLFLNALRDLDGEQHQHLINRGMNGTGNSTITQLILKNNHGYKDKQELEHSGNINVIIDR